MTVINIDREAIKLATRAKNLCNALCNALTEYQSEDGGSKRGRNAMRRLGGIVLRRVQNDNANVPFHNIDTMLSYINDAKLNAERTIKRIDSGAKSGFLDACKLASWRDTHSRIVASCEVFQAAWGEMKEVKAA